MPARLRAAALAAVALLACSSGSSTSTTLPPGSNPPPGGTTPPPTTSPCEQTGCDAGKYCDAATHLCRTGCATTADCAVTGQACGTDHVCRCPTDQHVCGGACVSSYDVATCGTRCTPCPEPASGGHATCGGWLTTPSCGVVCDAQGAKVCGDACLTCPGASAWTCGATAGTCVATSCQVGHRLVGSACVAWSRTAAAAAYLSDATAIALGPGDVPHIAWDKYAAGVWASTLAETGWTATKVGGDRAGRPRLAVDAGGTSHVLYAETIYPPGGDSHTDLVYARGDAAGFAPVTIAASISAAASGWVLSYALALDASGLPHVAYWDGSAGALRHAVRDADGAWAAEDVPGAGASSAVALAVDAAGTVHLAYREDATKSLVYVARTDAGWGAAETVDAVGGAGQDAPNGVAAAVSLAAGADGQPRVAYLDAGTAIGNSMTTWFARRGATAWTRARVYGAGTTYDAFAPALALDSVGAAHLASANGDGGVLYHEPISATDWRTSFLVLSGNAPGNVSLALDAQDQPHLAWVQYIANDSVWYAR